MAQVMGLAARFAEQIEYVLSMARSSECTSRRPLNSGYLVLVVQIYLVLFQFQ